jgi:tetratricopeptide (TPR) repeat protein
MRKDYEILGIGEDADEKAIKRAYFKLIRKHSPEKDPEQFQEIRAAYERLLEEKDKPENGIQLEFPADDKFALSMFDQIQRLMQEGEYDRAARTAEEGMGYYQEVECFLYLYARCSILDGKTGKGVRAYEKLVKRYPEKLHYKSELAKAYHMRGYGRKAYAMFRSTYKMGWRETDFLNLYSMCCFERENYEEAVLVLKELIHSIPAEKEEQKIPEILEAYTGLFMLYISSPFPIDDTVAQFHAFLDRVGNRIHDYEEQLMAVFLFAHTVASMDEGEAIDELVEKMQELLPMTLGEDEPAEVAEAYDLMEDERFSELMKITVEAFTLMEYEESPEESFDEYVDFMQLDAFLCQLEAWPKQRGELELLKKEYPNIYECGSDIWKMLRESKGNRPFMKDAAMAEYGKKERKFQCGHYYEFYPEKRQELEQVQWDSQEDGTFVRQGRKIGRNEPCPCGSGKKYKNCCGKGL